MRVRLLSIVGCALVASTASAQEHASAKAPRVLVVIDAETREPLAGAVVRDLGTHNSMITSKDGAVGLFVPQFVKADGAVLRITKLGYEPGFLAVDPMVDSTIVLGMHHIAVDLPAVVTTADYRIDRDAGTRAGIAVRCQSKLDTCINEDQFADRPTFDLSRFVRQSGAVIPSVGEPKMHRADNGKPCTPTYYVDGLIWKGPFAGRDTNGSIDQAFRALDIQAIEIFRSEQPRPLRFWSDSACGVIAVWTK